MPAISSRLQQHSRRDRRQLGRGAGDDHLAAGRGDRHGRRDRQPRARPPRRRRDLVGRSARRIERGRAGVHRRRAPAARDPPDAAAASAIATCRAATCPRRTGIDRRRWACSCRPSRSSERISCCRTRCAARWCAAMGERPFQRHLFAGRADHLRRDDLFLPRDRPRAAAVGRRATACGWIAGTFLMWLGSILFVGSFVGNPALPGRARARRAARRACSRSLATR